MTTWLITVKPSYVLIENLFMRWSAQFRFVEDQNRFKVIPWEVVSVLKNGAVSGVYVFTGTTHSFGGACGLRSRIQCREEIDFGFGRGALP